MKRWVYGYDLVGGPPPSLATALRTHVRDLLREATGTQQSPTAVDGSFVLRLTTDVAGTRPAKQVRATTGVATERDGRTRIPLAWHADPARHAYPAFEGAIELEPLSDRHAQLTVVGAYTVPLGLLGAALDGLALGAAAERMIVALASRLGERLEAFVAAGSPVTAEPVGRGTSSLQVRDVMTPDPMVFDESLSLRTAALLLVYRGVQGAPVVAADGALVGVLSEQDLLEKEAALRPLIGRAARDRERRRSARTAGAACTRPARVTVPDATLRDAARTMLDHRVARLVVIDNSSIAGIVTRHDVLKALLRSDAELQKTVDAALASLHEPEVRATVTWGEVTLEGTASLRSKVPQIVRRVSEIDGIIAVHGEPSWRDDDVLADVYGSGALWR